MTSHFRSSSLRLDDSIHVKVRQTCVEMISCKANIPDFESAFLRLRVLSAELVVEQRLCLSAVGAELSGKLLLRASDHYASIGGLVHCVSCPSRVTQSHWNRHGSPAPMLATSE